MFALCTMPAHSAKLRLLSSYDQTAVYTQEVAMRYVDLVQEASSDGITISFDGPGVVPPGEQLQPVSAGVFQILFTHGAYHTSTTGVGAAMDGVLVDPAKTRETGLWDFIDKHYSEFGLKLLAIPPLGTSGFQYILEEPITGEPALKGRRLRGSPTYTNVTQGLGGTPVLMSSGDVYSALDRGVIDGAAWGLNGVEDLGWHEVAGYFTKPTFGQTYTYLLMNLKAFEKLDEAEQAIMLEQGRILETQTAAILDDLAIKEWESLKEKGMQETEFSATEAAQLDSLVTEGIWQLGIDKSPEAVTEMRKIATKNEMTPLK